jgi:predicted MPP superfamily phosphohydrolase
MRVTSNKKPRLLGINRAGVFARIKKYWVDPYYQIDVVRYSIDLKGLQQDVKVVVASDIHASTKFMPAARIRKVVEICNDLSPEIIVLPGDFMAEENSFQTPLKFDELVTELSSLSAPQGVYAVMGNHDWWDDKGTQPNGIGPCRTIGELSCVGIKSLSNEAVSLDALNLAGLDSQHAMFRNGNKHVGRHDVEQALASTDQSKPTVMLAHEPDIWPDLPDSVDLTISGHTHGGQVTVFGSRPVVPSKFGSRLAYGHHVSGSKNLIVSGGLGCSKAPLRLGVVPEIVEITLKAPPATK